MEKDLKKPLEIAVRFLEEQGLQYSIIGGIALAQWNVARFTHDIDIKVLVPDIDYGAVRNKLRQAFPVGARLGAPKNPLIVAVMIEGVIVDFLLALPGYEELIIKRASQRDLGGFQAWICSADDLIIQKVVAGRGKDWLDVEALLIEQWGKLDEAYIRDWLSQFAEALENPEMLAQYITLREKVGKLFD